MTTAVETILTTGQIHEAVMNIAEQIHREFPNPENLIILGIRTRGALLSARIHRILETLYECEIANGILDITLYRDDLSDLGPQPMVRDSEINDDLNGRQIVLVDDVLFTGRTIRAAMDEIIDYGRPGMIRLAVLVDRGCNEYPIRADYAGKVISTTLDQHVVVSLSEIDQREDVILKLKNG